MECRNCSLDGYCSNEYIANVLKFLIGKEGRRRKFFYQSPQITERPRLYSWIGKMSKQLNLQSTTLHLAVYVLDIFMDNHDVVSSRLKLLAIVCLLLSAKFEELDSNIPKISTLREILDSDVEATEFITMELVILKFLKWQMAHPTTAHFIEMLSSFAVQPDDLICCRENHVDTISNESIRCTLKSLKLDASEIIQNLMDITITDTSYMEFRPSIIAASIISLARSQLMLKPCWTSSLAQITGMDEAEFSLCLAWLAREIETGQETSVSIDQGYFTGGSSCSTNRSPDATKSPYP